MYHRGTVRCQSPEFSNILPPLSSILIVGSGIYVPDDERWPEKFRGIGIRIEDSVCVGDDHPIVLTPEAVKEVCWVYRAGLS